MITLILLHLILNSFNFAPPEDFREDNTITVEIQNIKNDDGYIILSIFTDEDGFPMETEKAVRNVKVPITNDSTVFSISDLLPGTYALAVVHDENMNGKLDTNFLGMPKEGACASNNAKGRLGPPKFKDAAFSIEKGETYMELEMIYFLKN